MAKRKRATTKSSSTSDVSTTVPLNYNRLSTESDNVNIRFQELCKKFVEKTKDQVTFTVPEASNALNASRNELYRICSIFVELSMMVQLNSTTFKWAEDATANVSKKTNKKAKKNNKKSTTTQNNGNELETSKAVLENIASLEEQSLSLDVYLAAAHHTFNTFVNHRDNAKYGCLFEQDLKMWFDAGETVHGDSIGFAIHGPPESRIEIPHPDDHLPVPVVDSSSTSSSSSSSSSSTSSSSSSSSSTTSNKISRRYQLYMMSRDGPFSINFIGKKTERRQEHQDEQGNVLTRGKLYGEPVLGVSDYGFGGSLPVHNVTKINTTSLRRDQYSVYQLPQWNRLELNESIPRSEWQKAHAKWT